MQPFVRVSVCVREIVVSSLCSAACQEPDTPVPGEATEVQPFVRVSVCVREIVVSSLCSAGGDSVPAASSAGAGSCAGARVWQTNGVYFLNGVALEDPLVEEIPVEEPDTPADGSAFNLVVQEMGERIIWQVPTTFGQVSFGQA